jgi:hypothetical protein
MGMNATMCGMQSGQGGHDDAGKVVTQPNIMINAFLPSGTIELEMQVGRVARTAAVPPRDGSLL